MPSLPCCPLDNSRCQSDDVPFFSPASQPQFKTVYDISSLTALPSVEILYGYQVRSDPAYLDQLSRIEFSDLSS